MLQDPEEIVDTEVETVSEIEDIEALKKALEEEKARAEANLAGWQRAQADFINYKRRTEQEKTETGKFAKAELITALLPVLDNLERAFDSVPEPADGAWVDGIKLIGGSLLSALEAQGLTRINAVGEPFDPNIHEAAIYAPGEEGIVVRETKKGYKFDGRVIRPSVVVVGNGQKGVEAESAKED